MGFKLGSSSSFRILIIDEKLLLHLIFLLDKAILIKRLIGIYRLILDGYGTNHVFKE